MTEIDLAAYRSLLLGYAGTPEVINNIDARKIVLLTLDAHTELRWLAARIMREAAAAIDQDRYAEALDILTKGADEMAGVPRGVPVH